MNRIYLSYWPEAKALCILNLSHPPDNIGGIFQVFEYIFYNLEIKREKKGGLNFGLDLATSLTVRIYVPQSGKAVVGGPQLTDGSQCQSLGLQKIQRKIQSIQGQIQRPIQKHKKHSSVNGWFPMPNFYHHTTKLCS